MTSPTPSDSTLSASLPHSADTNARYSESILLIEDCAETRRDLMTALKFLGERALAVTSEEAEASMSARSEASDRVGLAIVGSSVPNLIQTLNTLSECDSTLPFLLIGSQAEGMLAAHPMLAAKVVAQLAHDCGFQPLLDAIHKSRLYNQHSQRLRGSSAVRDYNMFRSLVGRSDEIERVRKMMGQVANTEVSVLITGESGTGKEVVARNLHNNSARAAGAFVPINCGAIPRELLESELFGHEKGAFTGAVAARSGRFEIADGGTLFLDEIGDMPLDMQVKLLRVLQERSFERVGGVETLTADVRIVAATHRDLEKMIESGEFRQDLYYRLNVFPIEMPALRERPNDIPLLLNELIASLEQEGRGSVRFNSAAIAALTLHSWPGNVRELANLVERMAILHPHGIVGLKDLPQKLRMLAETQSHSLPEDLPLEAAPPSMPATAPSSRALSLTGLDLKEYLAGLERDLIEKALDDSRGVVTRAADRLGIGRTTLVEKMRKYKLPRLGDESHEQQGQDEDKDGDSEHARFSDPASRLQ